MVVLVVVVVVGAGVVVVTLVVLCVLGAAVVDDTVVPHPAQRLQPILIQSFWEARWFQNCPHRIFWVNKRCAPF